MCSFVAGLFKFPKFFINKINEKDLRKVKTFFEKGPNFTVETGDRIESKNAKIEWKYLFNKYINVVNIYYNLNKTIYYKGWIIKLNYKFLL